MVSPGRQIYLLAVRWGQRVVGRTGESVRRLTVKQRVLLHLFDYTRFAEAYEVPIGVTQEGIAKATAIRVGHVVQYVRPLQEELLVEERMSHIVRQGRRRKVYFLTPKGRQDAAALRGTLLTEEVPFRKGSGEITAMPLTKVYHEERHGSSLLQLLEETNSKGAIAQVVEVETTPLADFTQEAPKAGPFYGRTGELEAILHAVGEKPVVVVSGFAGIGKTTLGAKVCETLRGTCPLFWRQVRPWDTATDLAARLAAFLKALGRTELHNLFSLSEARELSRIEELLGADLAQLRVVLIFDDVHDASEEGEAFLSLLARVLQKQRGTSAIFLSRTAPRFYGQRELLLEGSVTAVRLEGLDKKSSASLLSDAGVPSASINLITQASGGNPLFLKLYASQGAHEARAKGWDTVATYIAEQIEPSLDDAERECLVAASFYSVPVPAQGLLLDGQSDARPLVGLQRKGLLGQVASGKYVLHDTLKEYFQQSLASDRRKVLNAKAVAWLSDQAERASEAGSLQDAVAYLGNAAELELDRTRSATIMERIGVLRMMIVQVVGAENAFRAALEEAGEPRARARLHGKVGQALQGYIWRLDEADREVDKGLALLPEDPTPEAVLLWVRKSDIALYSRDFDRVDAAIRRAGDIADRLPSDDSIRARVALGKARLRNFDAKRFDIRAVEEDCRTAIEGFKKARIEWLQGVAYAELAAALIRAGRIDEAMAAMSKAATHSRAGGQSFNEVGTIAGLAYVLVCYVGDFERAEGLLQEKLRLAKRYDLIWPFLETYLEFANLFRRQGRYEEARESLEYFLRMTAEGELYRLSISWWLGGGRLNDLTLMARLCARCGDLVAAEAYLNQAHELARGRPPEMSAFELAWAEAGIHLAKAEVGRAEASYRRALDLSPPFIIQRMSHEDEPRAECLLDFGRCLAFRGNRSQAKEVLTAALAIFTNRSMKPLEREAQEALKST